MRADLPSIDRVFAAALVLVGTAALWTAWPMPRNAGMFPRGVSILLIALGAAALVRSLRRSARLRSESFFISPQRLLVCLAATVGYVGATDLIGFYLASVVFVPAVAWFAGYRRTAQIALCTVAVVGGCYLVLFYFGQDMPGPRWER